MKKIFISILLLTSFSANAAITIGDVISAASCNSVADTQFFVRELTSKYGQPRLEQGAYWFKGSGEIYGSAIKEIFVSNTPMQKFVGVVLENAPTDVVAKIKTSIQYPTNVHQNGNYWVGADGREIMWHAQKYTKIFCTTH
jgi:phosphoheptose isomerase